MFTFNEGTSLEEYGHAWGKVKDLNLTQSFMQLTSLEMETTGDGDNWSSLEMKLTGDEANWR